MNVLLANWHAYTYMFRGIETFLRDLALGLERRGHSTAVYCDSAIARPFEAEGLRVCRNLQQLPFRPDIVHGHFGGETMAAVIALPGVPAIFFSHAGVRSVPIPRHPRIYRYAAMSPALATRLVVESAIEESAMDVVLNTVDLTRFTKVRRPPPRPARALFYNSDHGPNGPLTIAIEKAANAAGLTLDCIGHRFGRVLERPQQALLDYDIVFTAGKSALDAMACGAAVITVGLTSCGELVGPDNFDRLRRANFSVGVNSVLPSPDGIHAEIGRYTPEGCAVVTARVRKEADGELMISQMEEIYRKAIAAHAASTPDHLAEQRAVARYFRELVPLISLVHETTTDAGIAPMTGASARHLASAQVSALENGGYASAE